MLDLRGPTTRQALLAVVAAFALTRGIVLAALHVGAANMTAARRAGWAWIPEKSDLFRGPAPPPLLAPTVRWDANFYLAIARNGYPERRTDGGPVYAVAFFPLYPLSVTALDAVLRNAFWSAVLVANAFALVAALLVFQLGKTYGSTERGFWAALLFLVAPGSHFLSLPYPESMFAAFLAAALLSLRKEQIAQAAVYGALASGTRSAGVVVAACLLYLAWQRRKRGVLDASKALAAAAVSLSGIAAFALFCHSRYGDALAFVHIQSRYVNERSIKLLGPLKALFSFGVDPDYYLVTIAAIVACIHLIRRAHALDTLAGWFLLLLPLWTGTLKAMIRYQSTNVGVIVGSASTIRPRVLAIACTVCLVLLIVEAALFGMGTGHY